MQKQQGVARGHGVGPQPTPLSPTRFLASPSQALKERASAEQGEVGVGRVWLPQTPEARWIGKRKFPNLMLNQNVPLQLLPRLLPSGAGTFRVFSAELVTHEGVTCACSFSAWHLHGILESTCLEADLLSNRCGRQS